jgi:hypothetical protein
MVRDASLVVVGVVTSVTSDELRVSRAAAGRGLRSRSLAVLFDSDAGGGVDASSRRQGERLGDRLEICVADRLTRQRALVCKVGVGRSAR